MDAKMRQSWMDSALSLGELATKGPSLFMAPWVASNATARVAVLVPIEEWHRLNQRARPTLKELLLAPEPRFEGGLPYPRRGRLRRRTPTTFE